MPATDYFAEGLPVQVLRQADQERYVFGVELEGAFIPLATVALGYVDPLIESARLEAKTAAANEPQPAPADQPPPGPPSPPQQPQQQ